MSLQLLISNIGDLRKTSPKRNAGVVSGEVATTPIYLGAAGDDITIIVCKHRSVRPDERVADYRDIVISKGKAFFYLVQ